MRNMHRERLAHLLANAILELWKKETGSLSSVVIEGTICITSSTGKTTVLQVADRFTGSIPEAEDDGEHSFSSPPESSRVRYNHNHNHNPSHHHHHQDHMGVMRGFSLPNAYSDTAPPRVDCQNQTAMAAFLDNLSPASLVSPGTENSRGCSQERRSPTPSQPMRREGGVGSVNSTENAMDISSTSIKEEISESGSDTVNDDKNDATANPDTSVGDVCAGTGYYTCAPQELNNNTIDPNKYPLKFHKGRSPKLSPERNKRQHSQEHSPHSKEHRATNRKRSSMESVHKSSPSPGSDRSTIGDLRHEIAAPTNTCGPLQGSDAMDLTRKGVDDLALSPPHSYTAQVRDIIRQRVLAQQMKAAVPSSTQGRESPDPDPEAEFARPPSGSYGHFQGHGQHILEKASMPRVLESIGLHRSDSEEADGGEPRDTHHPYPHQQHHYRESRQQPVTMETHYAAEDYRMRRERERTPSESSTSSSSRGGGSGGGGATCSTPEEPLRLSVNRKTPQQAHPLLLGPVSPIVASTSTAAVSAHSPLPVTSNGHLHSILQQHRLYLPLAISGRPGALQGPNSAPPLFTHPGFSPLAMPQLSPVGGGGGGPGDASPSPTDLSLDSSGESEKEVGANGEQRVYRCEFCTKTFLFKSKYHEHLPVHTNARPFQCHLCSRTYKYKYDLRVHLRTHMGIPTKSTVCPFCNTKFDTNKRLRVHIKDAHKDKQKVNDDDVIINHAEENLATACNDNASV